MDRNGLTLPRVLRSQALMRIKSWDYRELRERIADGYMPRWFTHFYAQPLPARSGSACVDWQATETARSHSPIVSLCIVLRMITDVSRRHQLRCERSRVPASMLLDCDFRHGHSQRWYERLPLFLQQETKRE